MNGKPDPPLTTLAFYGSTMTASSLESAFHASVEWMERRGHAPTGVIRDRGEGGKGNMTFRRGYPKLLREGFEDLREVQVASAEEGRVRSLVDFIHNDEYDVAFAFIAGTEPRFQGELVEDLAASLFGALRPEYGFGHQLPSSRGPEYHAIGFIVGWDRGPEDRREWRCDAHNRDLWRFAGMKLRQFRAGFLRDVYPWNFLTAPMLARKVEGAPLGE